MGVRSGWKFVSMITTRRRDTVPGAMAVGVKSFNAIGGPRTFKTAFAAVTFGPLLELTAPGVRELMICIGKLLVTSTETVHVPFAGIVPPESERLTPPDTADSVPPQVVLAFGDAAFRRKNGY